MGCSDEKAGHGRESWSTIVNKTRVLSAPYADRPAPAVSADMTRCTTALLAEWLALASLLPFNIRLQIALTSTSTFKASAARSTGSSRFYGSQRMAVSLGSFPFGTGGSLLLQKGRDATVFVTVLCLFQMRASFARTASGRVVLSLFGIYCAPPCSSCRLSEPLQMVKAD